MFIHPLLVHTLLLEVLVHTALLNRVHGVDTLRGIVLLRHPFAFMLQRVRRLVRPFHIAVLGD